MQLAGETLLETSPPWKLDMVANLPCLLLPAGPMVLWLVRHDSRRFQVDVDSQGPGFGEGREDLPHLALQGALKGRDLAVTFGYSHYSKVATRALIQ